jgi:hypothetical protein
LKFKIRKNRVKVKVTLRKIYNIKHRKLGEIRKLKSNQKNRSKIKIKEPGKAVK